MSEVSKVKSISDAEWTVMRVFWELGEATTSDVVLALENEVYWKPKTIQTLIRRLVQKNVLCYEKRGREFLYRPTVDEKICKRVASREFLDRIFQGRLAPFLATFMERNECSDEDIAELKRLLKEGQTDGNDR